MRQVLVTTLLKFLTANTSKFGTLMFGNCIAMRAARDGARRRPWSQRCRDTLFSPQLEADCQTN